MGNGLTLDPTILREYDIRGLVAENLGPDQVRAIGRAFGSVVVESVGEENKIPVVAVGYDGRLSSPELEEALVEGLCACGVSVRCVGLGPTPMLYYAAHELNADGGMMITGSHNPPEYNGVKMMLGHDSFYGEEILALGQRIAAGNFASGDGDAITIDLQDDYIQRMLEDLETDTEMTVAWDPGNGASGEIVRRLVNFLPGEHHLINAEIDGNFPNHHPDPTVEKNLAQLKKVVAEKGCDLGIGFDGDGDRIGVVDAKGGVLWGDQLMVLFAREVLASCPGAPIISEVKASKVLFDEIAKAGGEPIMWKAGHSLIKAKMAETNSPFAGEMSGHIFFADKYYGFDDAIYSAIRLLSILGQTSGSLTVIRDALPQMMNTPELRFDCPEDRKFAVIDEVKVRLASEVGVTVHDIDGVRVENEDGWWLLRASNTQAVLVARCESATEDGLDKLKHTVGAQLIASGLEPPSFD